MDRGDAVAGDTHHFPVPIIAMGSDLSATW
jgi:hypothetical protein